VSCPDVLLNIATAARLFHTSDGTGFANLTIDGHRETWPLRSKRFGAWLRQQYYERTWDAPSPAALNAALNVLEAQPSRALIASTATLACSLASKTTSAAAWHWLQTYTTNHSGKSNCHASQRDIGAPPP
jgi:hypothetical protein